uniref:TSA: Wollemia nobilis Ref_Wollemi_Transcript_25443_1397 transcribed RNA sequence n=1 Tax=Wollemia nobilis TaxID=56998 RepID=A0A0C9QM00_9CONI
MSRILVQPIGQKRLTNVAVVRLKKHGMRFEIACYKNKVLSWRSGVEKDLDEVLQSHTVYSNVSKGVLAKSKDLIKAFETDDQEKICLEILDKGELQVAGKERESQLSSQFRDIATIIMEKTINPETDRPYTINMIERLMHEVHFAVDPHKSSKQQALDLIRELQKHFPIKRSPMKLRIVIPDNQEGNLLTKLETWNTCMESKDVSGNQISVVCQIEPGYFRDCDTIVRECKGRLEILSVSVHKEGDLRVDEYDDEDASTRNLSISELERNESPSQVKELTVSMQNTTIAGDDSSSDRNFSTREEASSGGAGIKQIGKKGQRCTTCNAIVGEAKEYRDHFKSDWHKHNLKRKTQQLPPLSAEECLVDREVIDLQNDLHDYSF